MSLFLSLFFLFYSLMHAYVWLRARAALNLGGAASALLALFMACMIVMPVAVRQLEKAGHEGMAVLASWAAYLWLGLMLLHVSYSICFDLLGVAAKLMKKAGGGNIPGFAPMSAGAVFLATLLLSTATSVYGYFEAKNIRTEHLTIKTLRLPAEIKRLRIVQLSDVHLGLIIRKKRLEAMMTEVKKASPDLLVSTGDLVDGQINGLEGLDRIFAEVSPPLGKVAVTGNHEFFAGINNAVGFTEKAGFAMLRNRGITIGNILNVAGVDDAANRYFKGSPVPPEKEILSGLQNGKFTLLLKHRPLVDASCLNMFDLQLSGHTHKGQIFPFSLITRLYYPHDSGHVGLKGGSSLYISSGTGTWGPPIRFLSPPEITVIDLVREETNEGA